LKCLALFTFDDVLPPLAVVKASYGMQGHAGTVPMSLRKDPMVVAAQVIAKLEDICHAILSNDTSR